MSLAIFITVIIFAASIWYLASPLLEKVASENMVHPSKQSLNELSLKKEEILSSLKDLELDHQLKKISDEDYKEEYQNTFNEGTEILKDIDREREAVIASKTQSRKLPQFCAHCGESLVEKARFCAYCGGGDFEDRRLMTEG